MPSTAKKKKKNPGADAVVVFSRVSRALHKLLLKEATELEVPLSVLVRQRLERVYGVAG